MSRFNIFADNFISCEINTTKGVIYTITITYSMFRADPSAIMQFSRAAPTFYRARIHHVHEQYIINTHTVVLALKCKMGNVNDKRF